MNVELIAYTPNPDGVANMGAETCVSSDIPIPDTGANGQKALKHALDSGHESVAEHAVFTFSIEGISRACSHQLVRHRMASYSQQSQRYVKMDGFGYVTPRSVQNSCYVVPDRIKVKVFSPDDPKDSKLFETRRVEEAYHEIMKDIRYLYRHMIACGIPEEDARYILPNACRTNMIVTMNARELRHFFALRCCNRAQWEIRELANRMLALAENVAPTIFLDAGASCVTLGYCPEGKKSCGAVPTLKQLQDVYAEDQKE